MKDSPKPKETIPRGGGDDKIVAVKVLVQTILSFLAEHGLAAGLISTSSGVLINKIPVTAIAKYIGDSLPQNLPDLEKARLKEQFILVDREKIYFDPCDQNLKYLSKILEDKTIPFEEKEKVARSILTKYLNLKTQSGRRNFVLCIVFIIYILSIQNPSSFYIMMQSLIKAIREGKISKVMGRLIVRRLRKKGILVDPELADIVAS